MQRGSRELENNGYLPGIPSTNSRMRVKTPQKSTGKVNSSIYHILNNLRPLRALN